MPPSIASDLSSAPPSPAPPSPAPSTSPPRTSPAPVKDTILKSTDAGVKKPAQKKKKKAKKSGSRPNQKAKQALQKMHAFFKAHRGDDECKNMSFSEQQKVLGKLWKASPENPKNGGV